MYIYTYIVSTKIDGDARPVRAAAMTEGVTSFHFHVTGVAFCSSSLGLVHSLPVASLYYEQALVCLSNREIVDASRGRIFHCIMANNRFFFKLFWPSLFSHLAPFNYYGKCPPYPRVDGFFFVKLGPAHSNENLSDNPKHDSTPPPSLTIPAPPLQ